MRLSKPPSTHPPACPSIRAPTHPSAIIAAPGTTDACGPRLREQAPPAWAIGAKCQAVWSADGEWYDATVEGVTAAETFVVKFVEYDNSEEVRGAVRFSWELQEQRLRFVSACAAARVGAVFRRACLGRDADEPKRMVSTNGIHLVLFSSQNRTFWPCVVGLGDAPWDCAAQAHH
jgi:Survival motor neuron protein (SMN)